jgi:putative glutathione S-transferase
MQECCWLIPCADVVVRLTEADLRLYPTIIRYDSAYAILFKCSKHRVSDYPNLKAWLRDMYQLKVPSSGLQVGNAETVQSA